jgi:hypothetical protein
VLSQLAGARINVFLFPSDSLSKRDIVRYRSERDYEMS